MGDFSRWLLHEDQKAIFDLLFAIVLTLFFLGIAALVLWPLERPAMALALAKGYWVFGIVLSITGSLLVAMQRALRVDMDSHFDAYVISALILSGLLQAGWSAFAALTIDGFVGDAAGWVTVVLHVVGVLSCYAAYVGVSAFYPGSIYRLINLPVAMVSLAVFGVWPAAASATYGWFFDWVRAVTS